MKISIVIPTLNEEDNILRAIERAAALDPHEIIVCDGGSVDETVAIARRLSCRVVESPRGRAIQQNHGAAHATGENLLFLHADCWLPAGALSQIEQALSNPRILCGAFRHRIDSPGLLYRLIERGDSLRVRLFGLPYGDQGIFVRRRAFEQVGGFPEAPLMEEVLLMRKLRRLSPVPLLPGLMATSARRWQRHGVIRQTLRNWSILAGERLGVPLDQLAKRYAPPTPTCREREIV